MMLIHLMAAAGTFAAVPSAFDLADLHTSRRIVVASPRSRSRYRMLSLDDPVSRRRGAKVKLRWRKVAVTLPLPIPRG